MAKAIRQLKNKFGDDENAWVWGKMHMLTFEHVLGEKKPLDRLFNIGPFPIEGSHLTVNKRQYPYQNAL